MRNRTEKPLSLILGEVMNELFSNCNEKENRIVSGFGVSIVEAKSLRKMNDFESLTVNQLAHELHLTSSRITRIIDNLVEKELVSREIDAQDRRVYNLSLTEKGKKLTGELIESYKKVHSEILQNIPEEHHKKMIEALELLSIAVLKWLEE